MGTKNDFIIVVPKDVGRDSRILSQKSLKQIGLCTFTISTTDGDNSWHNNFISTDILNIKTSLFLPPCNIVLVQVWIYIPFELLLLIISIRCIFVLRASAAVMLIDRFIASLLQRLTLTLGCNFSLRKKSKIDPSIINSVNLMKSMYSVAVMLQVAVDSIFR
ncbi:hypothetical protein BDC45DRAFT_561156 [Circinella umbellata]|nr:hypothetical protein BDC45DRAFT_561156 [Circinella umbellata]